MEAARPATAAAAPAVSTTLSYLPVGLFGAVMGLTGMALAWRLAHQAFGAPAAIGQAIGALAVVTFVVLAVAYGIKAAAGWSTVRAEFSHPVGGNLFGTPLISLLLLPFLLADISLALARLVHLPACSPFRVAWWAASFPLAASAVTALRYAAVAGNPVMDGIALFILGIATLVIAVFAVQTLAGIVRGRLRELS